LVGGSNPPVATSKTYRQINQLDENHPLSRGVFHVATCRKSPQAISMGYNHPRQVRATRMRHDNHAPLGYPVRRNSSHPRTISPQLGWPSVAPRWPHFSHAMHSRSRSLGVFGRQRMRNGTVAMGRLWPQPARSAVGPVSAYRRASMCEVASETLIAAPDSYRSRSAPTGRPYGRGAAPCDVNVEHLQCCQVLGCIANFYGNSIVLLSIDACTLAPEKSGAFSVDGST
jgi:hypothetical protein